jgi:deazaflavin-dependent oxidoreductase (nitroreductase family)
MAQKPMTESEFKNLRRFIKPFSGLNVFVYRLTGGRLMGSFQGRPVCLVAMTGARSGKPRTIPLMYVPYKDGVILVASQGGAPKSPVWYYNLVEHPEVEVQVKGRKMKLRARQVEGEEKAEAWKACVEHYPAYDDYQARTDRSIPVFVCEP